MSNGVVVKGVEMSGKAKTCAERAIALIQGGQKLEDIAAALPEHMRADRFVRMAITMMRRPGLGDCTPLSLIASCFEAAQMGLYLDDELGHAYLVGFNNYNPETKRKVKEAMCMIGFRGYIYLGKATAGVNNVDPCLVYEADAFEYQKGTDPWIHHTPTRDTDNRGKITAAYNVIVYTNGLRSFEVMERVDIVKVQHRAQRSRKSPWNNPDDWGPMAMKTVIRKQFKYAGLSADLTLHAVRDEYYEAGIGRDPKEVEAEVVERKAFAETMSNGQSIAPTPVESKTDAAWDKHPTEMLAKTGHATTTPPQTGGPTPEERAKLIAEHMLLSGKLRRKRIPNDTLKGMSDNTLVDAVERLRQEVAETAKGPGDADSEASPFAG